MKSSEALRKAAENINEKTWTQGEYARDSDGDRVDALETYAVCWCGLGHIKRTLNVWHDNSTAASYLLKAMKARCPRIDYFHEWNDHPDRTAEEVKAMFLEAAQLAESEGE